MALFRRSLLVVAFAVVAWFLIVASTGSAAQASRSVVVKVRVVRAGTVRVAASHPPLVCRGGFVCQETLQVRSGRPLVFRAFAATGWRLKAWESGCHDSAATCSSPLKARLNVTVKFVQRPPKGLLGTLQAVACVSASNCWAVGYYDTWKPQTRLTEALHWDGTAWKRVVTPNPGGTLPGDASQLSGVACVSSENCWATGAYHETTKSGLAGLMVLHWDGTTWRRTPAPGTGQGYSAASVACVSASFCYLVGTESPPASSGNLALLWNGASWRKVAVPEPSGASGSADCALNGVTCTSTANCWAVGGSSPNNNKPILNQVLRWNGTNWQKAPAPAGRKTGADLYGVACASTHFCFAVGHGTGYKALRWNGTAWQTTPTKRGGHILNAVACPAASTCWAVGDDNTALHWNGRFWQHEKTPHLSSAVSQGYLELYGIACTSTHNCWAVGSYGPVPAHRPETLHWNGTRWTQIRS